MVVRGLMTHLVRMLRIAFHSFVEKLQVDKEVLLA